MSLKPPSLRKELASGRAPADALEYELAGEMASTLGRLGRQLETALAALRAFDAAQSPANRSGRAALVARAGMALWEFVVQREAIGLRDSAVVMRDYRVPPDVRARMGLFPPGGG